MRMDRKIIALSELGQRKTNIVWYHSYVKYNFLIMQMNLFTKTERLTDVENKLMKTW